MDDALKQALQYLNHAKTLREIAKEMEEEFDLLQSSQALIEVAEDYEQRAAELTGGFTPKNYPHAA
jgi:division protein CdvB (Snf7/Vps24/ESCRT-III family)